MKNILNEKPSNYLFGRLAASTRFVKDEDVNNKEVLNLGCGFGWCESNFLSRDVASMVGLEISDSDLSTARENIHDERVSFQVGSAISIPFPDNSFDTVVSWEVIEHIPKKKELEMFSEVQRVLRPGGVFYLSTPHHMFFVDILDPAWWFGHRHYSSERLSYYANLQNFDVEEVVIKGGRWTLLSIINLYFSKWILRRKPVFFDFFSEKEDEEYKKEDGFMNIFVKYRKRK